MLTRPLPPPKKSMTKESPPHHCVRDGGEHRERNWSIGIGALPLPHRNDHQDTPNP